MNAHTNEQFLEFLSQLKETNQTLDFFCDFEKISENVENVKLSLCILNSLIGAEDLRRAVELIWKRDKTAFSVMEILVAVRKNDRKKFVDSFGNCCRLDSMFKSVDRIMEFLDGTGLSELLKSRRIKDLVDYVFGIETGLDSNARKNRSGRLMENAVAGIFDSNGIHYRKEVSSTEWKELSKVLGEDEKRFDFVVESSGVNYMIEVNFYSGGGSKLNEVARSYSDIAPKINSVPGFEFVWITDGVGWESAKNKLQEAYNIIPRVYNLTNMEEFIKDIKQ